MRPPSPSARSAPPWTVSSRTSRSRPSLPRAYTCTSSASGSVAPATTYRFSTPYTSYYALHNLRHSAYGSHAPQRTLQCILQAVVSRLNPTIRADIMHHICHAVFVSVPLLKGCGPKFISRLMETIQLEVFPQALYTIGFVLLLIFRSLHGDRSACGLPAVLLHLCSHITYPCSCALLLALACTR